MDYHLEIPDQATQHKLFRQSILSVYRLYTAAAEACEKKEQSEIIWNFIILGIDSLISKLPIPDLPSTPEQLKELKDFLLDCRLAATQRQEL